MSTTKTPKRAKAYTVDEMRSRGDVIASLLNTDGWFDEIIRHNHRRFEVREHDGRVFHVVIEDVK